MEWIRIAFILNRIQLPFFCQALKSKIQKFLCRIHFYIHFFVCFFFNALVCGYSGLFIWALCADTAAAGLAWAKVLAYQLLK